MKHCPKCARNVRISKGVPYCEGCNKTLAFCLCKPLNAQFGEGN